MRIRLFAPGDEHAICEIYNHFVSHTVVTFEEVPLTPEQMRARIDNYRSKHPWLVCEAQGDDGRPQIVGYSYAAPYHARAAFRHTAEVTVYVRLGCERRGIGRALYGALLPQLQAQGCHALIAAIALPNAGSAGLHESLGFTQVGHLREVGRKLGRWVDVGHWQKTLPAPGND